MDIHVFKEKTGLPEAAINDLERYRELLAAGNEVMNLVGPATLPDFWRRHAFDSWQLTALAPTSAVWCDLGSGAGLPGVVLAIVQKHAGAGRTLLIDSVAKRCRFLHQVVEALGLPAEVTNARAETLKIRADIVTARACAPLDRLLDFAEPYLKRGATGLFLKGGQVQTELAEARRRRPGLDAEIIPSLSDPRGRILRIRSL